MTGTARTLVAMSLVVGLGYPLLWAQDLPPAAMIAIKGLAVGLLALVAATGARTPDGWLLASLLALGATGDVLLEIHFGAGAAAFAVGHVVAIGLYRRNRRPGISGLDRGMAGLLPVLAAALPAILLRGQAEAIPFAVYALLLGTMAASAWLSRFPRSLVALGALLFLASDMLIAARLGMEAKPAGISLAIWFLYYIGQLMIFLGVITSPSFPQTRNSRSKSAREFRFRGNDGKA